MSELPAVPNRGEDILSWARQLQRALRSWKPQASATIQVKTTEYGTQFETYNRDQWRVTRFQILQSNANEVTVSVGAWTRNGYRVVSEETVLDGLIGTHAVWYITISLQTTLAKNKALEPDSLIVNSTKWLDPNPQERDNTVRYIGKVTNDSDGNLLEIEQWVRHDIDDTVEIPDSEAPNDTAPPVIRTLGWNPTDNIHEHETAWYNSWNIEEDDGIPVEAVRFGFIEKNSNGGGDLKYGGFDGTLGAGANVQSSIQLKDDGTRSIVQINDFDVATSFPGESNNDYILVRDADGIGAGPDVAYMNGTDFAKTYGPTIRDYIEYNEPFSHNLLADLNDDGDHLWAWNNGVERNGAPYGNDYTRNWGNSIGNTNGQAGGSPSPQLIISLDNQYVADGTSGDTAFRWTDTLFNVDSTHRVEFDSTNDLDVSTAVNNAFYCKGGAWFDKSVFIERSTTANTDGLIIKDTPQNRVVTALDNSEDVVFKASANHAYAELAYDHATSGHGGYFSVPRAVSSLKLWLAYKPQDAALYTKDGHIDLDASAYVYKHNGNSGWTGTFQVTQAGITKDCKVSGGIIYEVS